MVSYHARWFGPLLVQLAYGPNWHVDWTHDNGDFVQDYFEIATLRREGDTILIVSVLFVTLMFGWRR